MNKLAAFNNMPQKQSMSAFANVPRRTEIMGQPHMLSYINPEEEAVLQQMRGGMPPVAGPGAVPAFWWHHDDDDDDDEPAASSNDGGGGFFESVGNALSGIGSAVSDTFKEVVSGGSAVTNTYNPTGGGRDFDADMSVGAINTGLTYSGSDPIVSGGFDFGDDDDDKPAVATGSSGYPSLDATAGVNTSHTPGSTIIDVSGISLDDLDISWDAFDWDAYNKSLGIDTSYAVGSGSGSLVTGGASDSSQDVFSGIDNTGYDYDVGDYDYGNDSSEVYYPNDYLNNGNTDQNNDTSYTAGYFVDGVEFQGPDYNFSSVDTSAKDADLGVGAINTGGTYSGYDPVVSGDGGDTSQLTDAEKEEIVMSQTVINDDGTLNTNIITPVVSPETTYTSPSLDPKKLLEAAEEGLLNVTTLGEDSVAVPYPSGVTINKFGGDETTYPTTSIIDAATGTLIGQFTATDSPDVDLVAAMKIAFDRGFNPNIDDLAFQDEVDKILFDEGYSYTQDQLSDNNYYELSEGVNLVLGEDISGAVTNKEGKLGLDFGQITESPFENAITVDVSQIQPDETETETEVETETGEVDMSAFGGAGGATTGGVDTSSIEGVMQASFGDLLNQDYTDYTDENFQGLDLTEGGNTIGYATSGENAGSLVIITPEGNIKILGPGSKETDIVFEGETAIDDAIDYLTGNADAEDVPSGEGETLTEFVPEFIEPSEPIEQDITTLEDPEFPDEGLDMIDTSSLEGVLEASGDIIFNEDGTVSTGDGDTYDTADEAIEAVINGSGTGGTGDGEGSGEGLGEGEGTGEGDGLGDGTGDGTGDGEDGDGDGAGTGDGEGEGDGTGDGTGDGDGEVNQVADSYRVDQQFAVRDIVDEFNRRRKSGLGYGLPEYMRRYMSGQVIDELVRRVELPDGSVFYVTPDGRYLDPKEFIGTKVLGDTQSIKTGEERYQSGYTTTNLRTGEQTRYDTDGNPIQT